MLTQSFRYNPNLHFQNAVLVGGRSVVPSTLAVIIRARPIASSRLAASPLAQQHLVTCFVFSSRWSVVYQMFNKVDLGANFSAMMTALLLYIVYPKRYSSCSSDLEAAINLTKAESLIYSRKKLCLPSLLALIIVCSEENKFRHTESCEKEADMETQRQAQI